MTTLDPRWRPSDADRDAYSAVIATAYEEGRITGDDMRARTELVYEAQRIADLDTVVEGLPGAPNASSTPKTPPPAAAPRKRSRIGPAFVAVAVVVGGVTIVGWESGQAQAPPPAVEVEEPPDVPPPAPVAEAWPAAEVPEIDTAMAEPLSQEHFQEAIDAVTANGIEQIQEATFWPDGSARMAVAAEGDLRALDNVDVDGGAVSNRSEGPSLQDHETDEATYFGWDDVDAATIAKAVDESPARAGVDAPVDLVVVSRSVFDGDEVVIRVYVDDRSIGFVVWSADGDFIEVT